MYEGKKGNSNVKKIIHRGDSLLSVFPINLQALDTNQSDRLDCTSSSNMP
jgi:hypothetical protein